MNPDLVKLIVGAVVRWALGLLGMYLVNKHWLTPEQAPAVITDLATHILAIAAIVMPLVWSVVNKVHLHQERGW